MGVRLSGLWGCAQPGLWGCAQSYHKDPYERKAGGSESEGDVTP